MTPEQFGLWRRDRFRTRTKAAAALGLSAETIENYERGERRDGRAVIIPKTVALACSAIAFGLPPYGDPPKSLGETE